MTLVGFGKKIIEIISSREGKIDKPSILLGPKSASLVGLYHLNKNFPEKEFKEQAAWEIERGEFSFNKKEFIVIYSEKVEIGKTPQDEANKDSSIFGKLIIVHLDWKGNLLSFIKF